MLDTLVALVAETGDSPALDAIRTAFTSIGERTRAVLGEAKTRLVATATAASAHVTAALETVGREVRKVTAPIARALSRAMDAVIANVRPLARSLAQSAALIARAVRAKAARALARAMPYIEAGRSALSAALDRAGTFVSEVGTQAAAAVRAVMQKIGDGLAHLRHRGDTSPFAGIAESIGRIGPAIDALWAAGKRRTARLLNQAVPKLTLVVKNVLEATEAMASVAGQRTRAMLTAAIAEVRRARAAFTPGEPASLEALQRANVTLAASMEAGSSTALPSQWQAATEAAAALHTTLEQVAPDAEAVTLATVEPALDTLTTKLDAINAAELRDEATRVQQVIRASVPANAQEAPLELSPGGAPDAAADADAVPCLSLRGNSPQPPPPTPHVRSISASGSTNSPFNITAILHIGAYLPQSMPSMTRCI